MNWKDKFIAIDTETTGLGSDARILEIGLALFLRHESGLYRLSDRWSSLVDPGDIDWEADSVKAACSKNRITKDMMRFARPFPDVFLDMCLRIGAADVWVGHNIAFDMKMLRQERQRHESTMTEDATGAIPRPIMLLDTCALDYHFDKARHSHSLEATARRHKIRIENCHRALDDAVTAGAIAGNLIPRMWDSLSRARQLAKTAESEFAQYRARKDDEVRHTRRQ